jgi:hypothetical protein
MRVENLDKRLVRMDMNAVREVTLAINATHRFIYLIPEAAEEAASSA